MASPPAAAAPNSALAPANGQPSSDIREMLLSSLATNNKVLTKELPELQRRAAKYHASLQKAHEDGLALSQALASVAEANTNSELNRSWTFFSEDVKQHEGLRQDLIKVIAETFVTPLSKSSDADDWTRLEKEIRRETERYDAEALKSTSNMNKLGKGGSSEVLAKAVNELNSKVKEHEVKRSEMMTDADDFSFKRQVVWIHAFASFIRAHQGFIIAANQHIPTVSASLIQAEKLEFHPSHQHLPFQWRPAGSSGDLSAPGSPKAARSSVMVQLSSLGHSITSKIRPTSKKPEEKKKKMMQDDKAKERTDSSSLAISTSNTDVNPPLQTLSHVRAVFDYQAGDEDELTFKPGDIIAVIAMDDKDWWEGELNGQIGFFPSNYVEQTSSPKVLQAPAPYEPAVSSPRSVPAPVDMPLQATVPLSVVSPRHEALMPSNSMPPDAPALARRASAVPNPADAPQLARRPSAVPMSSDAPQLARRPSAVPMSSDAPQLARRGSLVPKPPAGERRGSRVGRDSSSGSGISASISPAPPTASLVTVTSAPTSMSGSQTGNIPADALSNSQPSSPMLARPQRNLSNSGGNVASAESAAPSPAPAPVPAPASAPSPSPSSVPAKPLPAAPSLSSPVVVRAAESTSVASLPSPHFTAPPPPPGGDLEKIGAASAFKISRPGTGSAIRPAPEAPAPAVSKVQVPKTPNDIVMHKLAVELQETEDVILALLPKQQLNGSAKPAAVVAKTAGPSDLNPVVVVPAPGSNAELFHPEDWEACTDDNGDTFYFNIKTSESVWEIPGFTAL